MIPLNSDFDFSHLDARKRAETLAAFTCTPQRTLFIPGTTFFRFITPQSRDCNGNALLDAEWWFGQETRRSLAALAHQMKMPLASVGRAKLAVTRKFNPRMEYLCSIELTAPVYGWAGNARWQFDQNLQRRLPGGSPQVFFPSLATYHQGLASRVARLRMWAFLDDAH